MRIELFLLILIDFIHLTNSISLHFSQPLQRFIYDDLTNTIILASVNHIYSLNASDLTILSDVNTSPLETDHQCPITNKTSTSSNTYYFSTSSYLPPYSNSTFNQLLILRNQSVLICSTSNRGGSCQLRSLIHLDLLKNSTQRVVSSSPHYSSVGFISQSNHVLYVSNTYDSLCDPFYEIPTISGRSMDDEFLSIINFNSGQSALQQSTYTLRLLNNRLIKDFFLHYIYAFEYEQFSYFLTIQQSDIHHTRKHKLQTKILRFCQTVQQPIIKSFVEIPLTCGKTYHYLVNAKFDTENKILYGIFRNTTLSTAGNTSHAVCAYTIDSIREAFYQTIKHCLVDGKGYRGLSYISPDVHCIANKNLNEINHDYCPNEDDSFFQYPIGGHRALDQMNPIIELHNQVNFTTLETVSFNNAQMIFLGDDHGTIHTFHTSNLDEIHRQTFPSSIIVDLKLINKQSMLRHANLLVLTNNQIVKQNLSDCDRFVNCDQCSNSSICHWCSKENRCAASFECTEEKSKKYQKFEQTDVCTTIQSVSPPSISLDSTIKQFEFSLNTPLRDSRNNYKCQFQIENRSELLFHTDLVEIEEKRFKCSPLVLSPLTDDAIYRVIFSIYHIQSNVSIGYYQLSFVNCSSLLSCSSCTNYGEHCRWNLQSVRCQSKTLNSSARKRLIVEPSQCPRVYLQQSINRLAWQTNQTLIIDFDQCEEIFNVDHCQLNDYRQRLSFVSKSVDLQIVSNQSKLCKLKCSFELFKSSETFNGIHLHRPLLLNLTVQLSNETFVSLSRSHISLYQCESMALNCSSCLQLDPSFGCIWCNNRCMLKNQTIAQKMICPQQQECLTPTIQTIEPLILPMSGGTIITIKGKHFNLFNLSITVADVPCQLIETESSTEKIICQSGDSGKVSRTGPVNLTFGSHGPKIQSHQTVTYINPVIDSIEPLLGIESGGTIITIHGENLTIGNNHVSILIGNRPCQLLSISRNKVQCETSSFISLETEESQSIKFYFDRQTKIISEKYFRVISNPKLESFSKNHRYLSFMSGGHQTIIVGTTFNAIQNIRLEFKRTIFVSPLFRNDTHLIFLTPSIQELYMNADTDYQDTVDMTIHLDHFNQTSAVTYVNDPLIYELEPMLQTFTHELTIQGANLTLIGHTKNDVLVHIGCDLCMITQLETDRIVCRPPLSRPKKYSKANRLCYESEHPWIIVTIDNIHSHVGYMMYPKRLIILGIIAGCLLTILLVISIVLIAICVRIRCNQRKNHRRYLYGAGSNSKHLEIEKVPYHQSIQSRTYQKLQPMETIVATDSMALSKVPNRSYVEYLQFCYFFNFQDQTCSYDIPKLIQKPELLDQFQNLITNHPTFVQTFIEILLKTNNRKLLNNLILTQRYQLKNLLQFSNDQIYFYICILTAYDGFLSNQINSIIYQIYYQLRMKISSGPIDAIDEKSSYYSLNNETILHDRSISFNPVQILVHIDWENVDDYLSIPVTCLTCDTISQVKQKILQQLYLYRSMTPISLNECQLYLLTNFKSNNHSCSTSSSCSSSTTSSTNLPIRKKSLLTQFFFHRSMKYSTTTTTTTTLNDSYRDAIVLLLNDLDNTNEQMTHSIKLNTLQHYGVVHDGHELKIVLPKMKKPMNSNNHPSPSPIFTRTIRSNYFNCQYCSLDREKIFAYLNSLPMTGTSCDFLSQDMDRTRYCHLLNHTYEEIGECGHLLMSNSQSETYRLFETKSIIHSALINFIETLFTDFLQNDNYLGELIEQYPRFLHIFYGHLIPFLLNHLDCLFDATIEKCLKSSFEILATIFQIACSNLSNDSRCLFCLETTKTSTTLSINIQNCTLLFADEIQRVRIHYSNLERRLNNKNGTSEYSSTNTGINRIFELDPSIIHTLIEYVCSRVDEIDGLLKNQSMDATVRIKFLNFAQIYRPIVAGKS